MQNPTWYNQRHGCCNIAIQSCNFIILLQHVLSCMNMAVDLSDDGSYNVVQVGSFIKPWTACSNMHEQACLQSCSSWPAQPCSSFWQAKTSCAFLRVKNKTLFILRSTVLEKPGVKGSRLDLNIIYTKLQQIEIQNPLQDEFLKDYDVNEPVDAGKAKSIVKLNQQTNFKIVYNCT